MQIVQAELERDRRAFLAHRLVGLVLDLLDDLFDARRVDAAVGDQPLDRLLRDLAAVGIEAGQDDRARRVVDDEIDAGRELERADVAPLAADDAALQVVARQVDDRDGRLDGVLGGAALDGLGDVLLGAVGGRFARFGVEPLQQIGRIVPRVAFDLLDQQLLGFVGGQAGDAFELVLLLRDELLVLRRGGGRRLLALVRRPARAPPAPSRAARSRPAARRAPLRAGSASARAPRPAGGPARACRSASTQQLVRLLLGVEQRFLLAGFGVALGVLDDAERLFFGAADGFGGDALAVGDPDGEHRAGRDERDDEVDDDSSTIGNTRDVLSRDPRRAAGSAPRAGHAPR